MDQSHQQKLAKYLDLVEEASNAGYQAKCLAFEVGLRGLTNETQLADLRQALGVPAKATSKLAVTVSRSAILGSFKVWCCRNITAD